jgi:hypothetical protein
MNVEDVKPGDILYIWGSSYISHGEDDVSGGKAIVKQVIKDNFLPSDHCNYYMVEFCNVPGRKYNLRVLLEKQSKLEKDYKDKIAYPDPDYTDYGYDW